jgi:hypothetical protein
MNPQQERQLENADKEELEKLVQQYGVNIDIGVVARERLAKLRHDALVPKPWYRTGIGWIAFLTLLAAIVAAVLAALALYK